MNVPLLRLETVGRRYGGLTAVDDVNLEIPGGARHAIIGPNGAGKTTLLQMIAGALRPTTGRILLDGHDVTRLTATAKARRGVGRTWQHPAVFTHLTVADHLALARRGGPATAVDPGATTTLLDSVSLRSQADTPAGRLAYGQRRLLELVTVLTSRPRLLLLDEPSAGLDDHARDRVADLIGELPSDVTLIIVDHDLDLVWRLADTVTVLNQGRHLVTGTPTQVRDDERVQRAYLGDPTADEPVARTGGNRNPPVLQVRHLRAGYHGAPVLNDIDIDLSPGEILAVLGRQGAGKTTLLSGLAGLAAPWPPTQISVDGISLQLGNAHRAIRAGVALVPQGRRLFSSLTVDEHLQVAVHHARPAGSRRRGALPTWSRAQVLDLFPSLARRLVHRANQLSGGEQQMLALARALLTNPRVLLLDEPSEGLAPTVRQQIAHTLRLLADDGLAIALAEPSLSLSTQVADRIIGLANGSIALCGSTGDFTNGVQREHLDSILGTTAVPTSQRPGADREGATSTNGEVVVPGR